LRMPLNYGNLALKRAGLLFTGTHLVHDSQVRPLFFSYGHAL
jgi:hypothetical protein